MWTSFAFATRLLTSLPSLTLEPFTRLSARQSIPFFPIIGAIVGSVVGAVWVLAAHLWSGQPAIAAAVALAATALLSAGRFLGGLAQSSDGIAAYSSGGGKPLAFAVMRDARRGTTGLVALAVSVAVKFAFLSALSTGTGWQSLIIASSMGGWGTAFAFSAFPLASSSNDDAESSYGLSDAGINEFVVASVIAIVCVAVLPTHGLLAMLAVAAVIGPLAQTINRTLGGLNRPLCFGLGELAEITALAALTIHVHT